jgi:hypothetical protein
MQKPDDGLLAGALQGFVSLRLGKPNRILAHAPIFFILERGRFRSVY